ncbi:uncharacterized protein LOC129320399 isoform X4 [Prosopis cineraria]|uniref:uncharacterized protein LOC129320399 isoform X4 n=1 Tax=Prosopis cineraria TaxID=364024 RepID=UPI00240FAD72|nr:uncharacterized protein LOC129320399 isoform X4 [Prosopis cineraria]
METRQKAIYLDRIKRRCGMTHSWYVDPIGLSGGLALWWKNDIDIHVIFSCKNYIHIAAASNSCDFLSQSEKLGGNPCFVHRILNFQKFAADCDLLDLEAKGSRFTWCNQRSNEECIKEKIDRAMANNHFRDAFPKALAFHIDAVASDHHFLLILKLMLWSLNLSHALNDAAKNLLFGARKPFLTIERLLMIY